MGISYGNNKTLNYKKYKIAIEKFLLKHNNTFQITYQIIFKLKNFKINFYFFKLSK